MPLCSHYLPNRPRRYWRRSRQDWLSKRRRRGQHPAGQDFSRLTGVSTRPSMYAASAPTKLSLGSHAKQASRVEPDPRHGSFTQALHGHARTSILHRSKRPTNSSAPFEFWSLKRLSRYGCRPIVGATLSSKRPHLHHSPGIPTCVLVCAAIGASAPVSKRHGAQVIASAQHCGARSAKAQVGERR